MKSRTPGSSPGPIAWLVLMWTLLSSSCSPNSPGLANAEDLRGPELATRREALTSCGDGAVSSGERCDDGNTTSGDGCSSSCAIEPGYVCRIPGQACLPRLCETSDREGRAFLRNNFVEIGLHPNAAFGSQLAPPDGWHPRANMSIPEEELGFVSDAESTDWTRYHGDFFTPGTPEETWGLTVNGTSYHNSRWGPLTEMAGSFGASSCAPVGICGARGGATVTWSSSSPVGGSISVRKTYTLVDGGAFIRIKVTLTNTTDSALSNVYYMRSVDPDNDQTLFGSYVTTNTIVSQPDGSSALAQVDASQTQGSVTSNVSYVAEDARARVTHGGFAVRGADNVWNGIGLNTSGSVTEDQAISIAFKFDSIPAGGAVSFVYAINLEASAGDALACLDDSDGDGVLDADDPQPDNPNICGVDADADTCDDCSSGTLNAAADGVDTDADGLCNDGDADDDNDGALDPDDSDDANPLLCRDADGDTCDDCTSGSFRPDSDGLDTDGDGQCDAGDPDDDNDQVADAADAFPLDVNESVDTDGDGLGNNADPDDDADGLDDSAEASLGSDPLDGKTQVRINGAGCSSTDGSRTSPGLLLAVTGLLWLSRRRHARHLQTAALVAAATLPTVALAQALDVQHFKPSPGAHDIQVVQSPRVAEHLQWSAGLLLQYAHEPLRLMVDPENRVAQRLVSSLATADLQGAVGLFGRFELGLSVPVSRMSGEDASAVRPEFGPGGTHWGLGHTRLIPKALLVERGGLSLGASVPLLLPGTATHFLASTGFAAQPRLLGEWRHHRVRVSGNLGLNLRREIKLAGLTVGSEIAYGLGLEVPFGCETQPFHLEGNLLGARALRSSAATHPREATVGLRYGLTPELGLRVGTGFGWGDGYGTPLYRMFAGLSWTASTRSTARGE